LNTEETEKYVKLKVMIEGQDKPLTFGRKKYAAAKVQLGNAVCNNLEVRVNDITLKAIEALTTHKCSGKEWESVVLMIDPQHMKQDYRSLLTALTRIREAIDPISGRIN
jgi:ribosomal protein S9